MQGVEVADTRVNTAIPSSGAGGVAGLFAAKAADVAGSLAAGGRGSPRPGGALAGRDRAMSFAETLHGNPRVAAVLPQVRGTERRGQRERHGDGTGSPGGAALSGKVPGVATATVFVPNGNRAVALVPPLIPALAMGAGGNTASSSPDSPAAEHDVAETMAPGGELSGLAGGGNFPTAARSAFTNSNTLATEQSTPAARGVFGVEAHPQGNSSPAAVARDDSAPADTADCANVGASAVGRDWPNGGGRGVFEADARGVGESFWPASGTQSPQARGETSDSGKTAAGEGDAGKMALKDGVLAMRVRAESGTSSLPGPDGATKLKTALQSPLGMEDAQRRAAGIGQGLAGGAQTGHAQPGKFVFGVEHTAKGEPGRAGAGREPAQARLANAKPRTQELAGSAAGSRAAGKEIAGRGMAQPDPAHLEPTQRDLIQHDLIQGDLTQHDLTQHDLTRQGPAHPELPREVPARRELVRSISATIDEKAGGKTGEKTDEKTGATAQAQTAGTASQEAAAGDAMPPAPPMGGAGVAAVGVLNAPSGGERTTASPAGGGPDNRVPQNVLDSTPLPVSGRTDGIAGGNATNALRAWSAAGAAEMRFDVKTDAFGRVEMHTVVRDDQVGLALFSERGDLRGALGANSGQLDANLRQHDLRLQELRFLGHGAAAGNSGGGPDRGPDRGSDRGSDRSLDRGPGTGGQPPASRAFPGERDSLSSRNEMGIERGLEAGMDVAAALYRKGGLSLRV